MYQWPSRQRSSTLVSNNSTTPTRIKPPTRPATTSPIPRTPSRAPSFGAAVIHTTPPPRSPAQLRATLDPARIGPTRMPSYVGSLLDAFTIDSIDERSLDLDRSFEVSPRTSFRSAPPPAPEDPSTTTISEEGEHHESESGHRTQFEGLQLTLSIPDRPFSMIGSMPVFSPQTPSPPPESSRPQTPRRIRLDSAAFEKPPQSFASVVPTPTSAARLRQRSCIFDCVRKSLMKKAIRKGAPSEADQ